MEYKIRLKRVKENERLNKDRNRLIGKLKRSRDGSRREDKRRLKQKRKVKKEEDKLEKDRIAKRGKETRAKGRKEMIRIIEMQDERVGQEKNTKGDRKDRVKQDRMTWDGIKV